MHYCTVILQIVLVECLVERIMGFALSPPAGVTLWGRGGAKAQQMVASDPSQGFPLDDMSSNRLRKARIRLAEAQGTLPIGTAAASEEGRLSISDVASEASKSTGVSKVREISWRVAKPDIVYDPVLIENELWIQPWVWLVRNVQFLVPFGVLTVEVLSDIFRGPEVEARNRRKRATALRDILSAQSPALIKAGQALASRSDLLPGEYLEELQKLQDRCPAFPTEDAFSEFENELGRQFGEVFELIEPEPIAAASIGQVYKARLRSNGALVAVKIQRPNCLSSISIDLYIMRWYSTLLQRLLNVLNREIDLVSIIDDFGELIYREIDYRAEAVNAQRFAELYSSIPDVLVPKVYTQFSSRKVLTMEWVDGVRLTDADKLAAMGLDSSKLIDTLVQCSLRQLLENGFFHADPHAGNLLATESGKLCYLDFGMTSYVERGQRYSIIEAVVHLVNRDFKSLGELYRRMGFIPTDVDSAPIVLALEEALPDVLNAPVGELNLKNVISKLGDVMYKFPFSLPPFYISIIRCLGVLEGLAIQVDKDFRIVNDAYPYIASRLLTDDSDELRSAVRQLLFDGDSARWERLRDLLDKASLTSDYDPTLAMEGLFDYLDSSEAAGLRETLLTDIVTFSDEVGAEGISYLQKLVITVLATSSNGPTAIPNLIKLFTTAAREVIAGRQPVPHLNDMKDIAELPENIELAFKLIRSIQASNPLSFQYIIQRIYQRPNLQQLFARIISEVSERQSARLVRGTLGVL